MNVDEATKLLTVISQYDGRVISVDMAAAWAFALDDVDAQDALLMVREHYRGDRRMYPIRPGDLVDMSKVKVEQTRYRMMADIRAAKGYGLIPKTWPVAQQLPEHIERELLKHRVLIQQAAGTLEELLTPVESPVDNAHGVRPRGLD